MRFGNIFLPAAIVFTTVSVVQAADSYPIKPVRVISTFSAGTAGDTMLRIVGRQVAPGLGQQFVMDYRVGANGLIGTSAAMRSPPDGYTLLFSNDALLINPALQRRPAYDPVADFAPVTVVASIPYVLAVHPSLSVRSVKELVALAKARPGEIQYGTGGIPQRLAMEMFAHASGIKLTHVGYKGTGPAFSDVLGGQIPMMFAGVTNAVPYAGSGRLRLLAVSSAKRSAALPEVPTMAEAAVPGYHYAVWLGLLAPAGTPDTAINRLHGEIDRALRLEETGREFLKLGIDAVGNTPAQFATQLREDRVRLARLVREAGIPVE